MALALQAAPEPLNTERVGNVQLRQRLFDLPQSVLVHTHPAPAVSHTQASAWAGALAMAGDGATIGTVLGSAFGPVGSAVDAVVGGIVGGIAGFVAGSWLSSLF